MDTSFSIAQRARVALTCVTSIPSPCISVCSMNPKTGYCNGCWRTLDEIGDWTHLSDENKRQVWRLLWLRSGSRLSKIPFKNPAQLQYEAH